jgi:hypothetical protein
MVNIKIDYLIGVQDMTIRSLVTAAALVAFTSPAFAQNGEEITILDDSVSTATHLNSAFLVGGLAAGFFIIAGGKSKTTVTTN